MKVALISRQLAIRTDNGPGVNQRETQYLPAEAYGLSVLVGGYPGLSIGGVAVKYGPRSITIKAPSMAPRPENPTRVCPEAPPQVTRNGFSTALGPVDGQAEIEISEELAAAARKAAEIQAALRAVVSCLHPRARRAGVPTDEPRVYVSVIGQGNNKWGFSYSSHDYRCRNEATNDALLAEFFRLC